MASKISDRSRSNCQTALRTLDWILEKYPSCPNVEKMSEEERALLLRKMQQFGNAVAATNYRKFSFYSDAVKNVRNIDAHSLEDDIQKINGIFQSFFGFTAAAKKELKKSIEKAYSQNKEIRKFEKYGEGFGSEENRKNIVDDIQDKIFGEEDEAEQSNANPQVQTQTENNILQAAKSILNRQNPFQKDLLDFAKSYNGLAENIQEEIVSWMQDIKKELKDNNPFAEEEAFVKKLKADLPNKKFPNDYPKIQSDYSALPSVEEFPSNMNFSFYQNAFAENAKLLEQKDKDGNVQKSAMEEFNKQNEILSRNLQADMQKELERRKAEWELEQIEKAREEMQEKLYRKIENFKKITRTLKNFTKDFDKLWGWGSEEGFFQDCGFEILEEYAGLLEHDKELQELSDMIGHHYEEEKKFHKELRTKIVTETFYNPEPAFKGEISGLRLSNKLPDVLPTELGLYINKKTRPIFKMKFAQKQLLSYAYTHNYEYQKTHEEQEEIEVGEPEEHKGPMIICVDTSGSMQGLPERVAKTIAFALTKKSLEEERHCYLISFSTGIETMDLSSFNSANGLTNLVKFLQMSFNGGTDATLALEHSLNLLETNETWKNSDVLMVSDFCMDGLNDSLSKRIKDQKENKTRFFSLAVTSGNDDNPIDVFDENWIYDITASDSGAKLVRQLAKINKR